MPRYQARPARAIEAFPIQSVGPRRGDGSIQLQLGQGGGTAVATEGMLARIIVHPGDYWVIQPDGYVYLNPKHVFESKYEPIREK